MYRSINNKCRICLEQGKLLSIFHKRGLTTISDKIMTLVKINVTPNDGLPDKICQRCIKKLDDCIEFIDLCESSDFKLRLFDRNKTTNENDKIWLEINPKGKCHDSSGDEKDNCLLVDDDVALHGDETSRVDIETDKRQSYKKTEKQQCFTCGKVMSSGFRLKMHLRTHTGERPYSCLHCQKSFSLHKDMIVHMRIHTGEKPLHCLICGKSFRQPSGLAAHKRKHTGQTPYQCLLCPRSFRTFGHWQYHTRRHTGEKNFECEKCNHAFITRSDLKNHLMSHTGDKPHVCCICGLRLTRASNLKRHIQHMHSDKKPFTCFNCTSKFNDNDEFELHKMTDCMSRHESKVVL